MVRGQSTFVASAFRRTTGRLTASAKASAVRRFSLRQGYGESAEASSGGGSFSEGGSFTRRRRPAATSCEIGSRLLRTLALPVCLLGVGSCHALVKQGLGSSYLVIEQLLAAPGASPSNFGNVLQSDVLSSGGIFEDIGQVKMGLGFKDPGSPSTPTAPTSANWITVNRYRVVYRRADGRNTPGVDVPYPFDGAATFTVAGPGTTATFTIVRAQAKLEAPLLTLVQIGGQIGGAQVISTIAEVTFYGRDQTGAEVAVSGSMSINFADWAG